VHVATQVSTRGHREAEAEAKGEESGGRVRGRSVWSGIQVDPGHVEVAMMLARAGLRSCESHLALGHSFALFNYRRSSRRCGAAWNSPEFVVRGATFPLVSSRRAEGARGRQDDRNAGKCREMPVRRSSEH